VTRREGIKELIQNKDTRIHTKIHHPYHQLLKSSKASISHVTSSFPGLSSIMDMSMTEISEKNQVLTVKGCIITHMFSIWKFYQKDDKTICGFIMKHTNRRGGTQNRWLGMQRILVKTHTDLCNNTIKNKQIKFKGEDMK
jgi:hypothetical protein